jgi:hypothetical protein
MTTPVQKKSVTRKGRATKGSITLFGQSQSGRSSVSVTGNVATVTATAIRNAAPRNETIRIVTSGGLTAREEDAYSLFRAIYAETLIPPTTRDFAARFGVSQSRAQQYFSAFQQAGRAVNTGNSSARAYVPAEAWNALQQFRKLILG